MIAPHSRYVRRLRVGVRAAVKANPRLRRERKRSRVGWRYRRYTWSALRFFVPLAAGAAYAADAPTAQIAGVMVAWSGVVLLTRAAQITSLFQTPAGLWLFYCQPLGSAEVFRHQWCLVLRSSFWLGADWLAVTLGGVVRFPSLAAGCAVPLIAFAQWAAALSVAMWLAKVRPRFPYAAAASVCGGVLFVLFRTFDSPVISPYSESLFRLVENVTPAGWLARAYIALLEGHSLALVIPLFLGLGAAALLRGSWLSLRTAFSLEGIFGYEAAVTENEDPGSATETNRTDQVIAPRDELEPEPAAATPVDLVALQSSLVRALEAPASLVLFQRGFLERYITRSLTLRQRVLVDFLQPRIFGWSRGWLIALGLIGLARLLHGMGVSGTSPAILALGGTAFLALPLFAISWRGFGAVDTFQTRIGIASFSPVSFWESARLLVAISLLRTLCGLPLLVFAIRFGADATLVSWSQSIEWALRGSVLLLAIQPLWVIFAFSKNSNDSAARGWFTAVIALVILSGLLVYGTAGVMLFAVNDPRLAVAAAGGLLVFAYGALAGYGWAYNRGVFDLIARPTRIE